MDADWTKPFFRILALLKNRIATKMLGFLLTVLAFLVFFSLFGLFISVRPPRIHSSFHPEATGLPYEDVVLTTSDGLHLKGWFFPQPASDKAIVGLHGYPADKGDILPVLLFLQQDFNLLVFDFRYFGESEGAYSTAGAKEIQDLLAGLAYLENRGLKKIGVWGFSMGGAVALMASAQSNAIKAVVSESSYADLYSMARETYRYLSILKVPLATLTGWWAKLFLGVDLHEASPVVKIRGSRLPILLIHSTTDQVIPFSHAERLKEALSENPKAEFWFREGSSHGELGGEYQSRIRAFYQKHL